MRFANFFQEFSSRASDYIEYSDIHAISMFEMKIIELFTQELEKARSLFVVYLFKPVQHVGRIHYCMHGCNIEYWICFNTMIGNVA